MRLLEFASADDLLKLWQIVSQNVFQAVEKERREAEEAQRLEASKPKKSRVVRGPSRSVSAVKAVRPKTLRPKTVKPQVANTQISKPQVVAVKPSSADMQLQTMAQKPFQKPFQQPNQTSAQKFLPQMPKRTVTP